MLSGIRSSWIVRSVLHRVPLGAFDTRRGLAYDPSSGGRLVGEVCTKHVADRLYVDSTVSHPSAAQRRPFSSRATERFPRSGVPNRTSLLPRAISPPCPSKRIDP